MSKFTIEVKPHALNKKGNPDYCVISLCLELDGMKFYDNHALFSSYVLEQNEHAEGLLQQVGEKLKEKFVSRFDLDEHIEDKVDYKDILQNMETIRKETIDS